MKQKIIRKLVAFYLLVLASCHIIGTWLVLNGPLGQEDSLLGKILLQEALGDDKYTVLAFLILIGFGLLWGILLLRNRIAAKRLLWFLVAINTLAVLWLWFMNTNGTVKGFGTAIWTNYVIMGIDVFFGLSYLFSRTD